jgi:predicted Ser/Thr protein kinase
MNTQKLELIISIIDKYLEYDYKKDVLTAVEAAELLDKAGVLKDSLSRPENLYEIF